MLSPRTKWNLLQAGTSALVGATVSRGMSAGWRRATGTKPPIAAGKGDMNWTRAIAWTVVTASAIGVLQLVAGRLAAGAWRKTTHREPPR